MNDKTPDNVYLNVNIKNPIEKNSLNNIKEEPIFAWFNKTYTEPIINDCSLYYVSVIRFDVPLSTLPLFIMPIIYNQSNANLTPLIIGINYLGTNYYENLIYEPDNNISPPIQNDPNKQVITPYYYVYTYQLLLNMLNKSLINVINSSGFVIPSNIGYPYFFLDTSEKLIKLVVPDIFTTGINKPIIYCNEMLLQYIESIEVFFWGYNQNDGRDFDFILDRNPIYPNYNNACDISGNPITIIYPNRPDYWLYTQEYTFLKYWTSIKKILFISDSLPVRKEIVPINDDDNSGLNNFLKILTDFVPQIETGFDNRDILYYEPVSQYRLVDLLCNQPLYKLDLKIYWQDKDDNLYPVTIQRNQEINIKLIFTKKTLYNKFNLLQK